MNIPFPSISRSRPGFTLIELLTVIAIIAILMGLLFPAVGAVKETAKRAQAKNDLTQIVVAVKAYYTDYGKYPVDQAGGAAADSPAGDFTTSNKDLFFILRAMKNGLNADHKLNPRKTVFMEGKDAKNFTNAQKATGGFDEKGNFYDPWGETDGKGGTYRVLIDANYDGNIENQYSKNAGQVPDLRTGVIAWSNGRDGKTDKSDKKSKDSDDDVISWQ